MKFKNSLLTESKPCNLGSIPALLLKLCAPMNFVQSSKILSNVFISEEFSPLSFKWTCPLLGLAVWHCGQGCKSWFFRFLVLFGFLKKNKKTQKGQKFCFFWFFNFFHKILHEVQTKLFTVYLMLLGDCYNNFVFINALQYAIYAYCISSFFRLKNKKTKNQKKPIKPKKQKTNF